MEKETLARAVPVLPISTGKCFPRGSNCSHAPRVSHRPGPQETPTAVGPLPWLQLSPANTSCRGRNGRNRDLGTFTQKNIRLEEFFIDLEMLAAVTTLRKAPEENLWVRTAHCLLWFLSDTAVNVPVRNLVRQQGKDRKLWCFCLGHSCP